MAEKKPTSSGDSASAEALIQKAVHEVAELESQGQDVSSVTSKIVKAQESLHRKEFRSAEMTARETIILAKVMGRVKPSRSATTVSSTKVRGVTGIRPAAKEAPSPKAQNQIQILETAIAKLHERMDAIEKAGAGLGRGEMERIAESAAEEITFATLQSDSLANRIREVAAQDAPEVLDRADVATVVDDALAADEFTARIHELVEKGTPQALDLDSVATVVQEMLTSDAFAERVQALLPKPEEDQPEPLTGDALEPALGELLEHSDDVRERVAGIARVLVAEAVREAAGQTESRIAELSEQTPTPESMSQAVEDRLSGLDLPDAATIDARVAELLESEDNRRRMSDVAEVAARQAVESVKTYTPEEIQELAREAQPQQDALTEDDVRRVAGEIASEQVDKAVGGIDMPTGPSEDDVRRIAEEIVAGTTANAPDLDALTAEMDRRLADVKVPAEEDIRAIALGAVSEALEGRPSIREDDVSRIAREATADAMAGLNVPGEDDIKAIVQTAVIEALETRPALGEDDVTRIAREAITDAMADAPNADSLSAELSKRLADIHVPSEDDIRGIARHAAGEALNERPFATVEDVASTVQQALNARPSLSEDEARQTAETVAEQVVYAALQSETLAGRIREVATESIPPVLSHEDVSAIVAEALTRRSTLSEEDARRIADDSAANAIAGMPSAEMVVEEIDRKLASLTVPGEEEIRTAAQSAAQEALGAQQTLGEDDVKRVAREVIADTMSNAPNADSLSAELSKRLSDIHVPSEDDIKTIAQTAASEALGEQPSLVEDDIRRVADEIATERARAAVADIAMPEAPSEDDLRRIADEAAERIISERAGDFATLSGMEERINQAMESALTAAQAAAAQVAVPTSEDIAHAATEAAQAAMADAPRGLSEDDVRSIAAGAVQEAAAPAVDEDRVRAVVAEAMAGQPEPLDADAVREAAQSAAQEAVQAATSEVVDETRVRAIVTEGMESLPDSGPDVMAIHQIVSEALAAQPKALDEARVREMIDSATQDDTGVDEQQVRAMVGEALEAASGGAVDVEAVHKIVEDVLAAQPAVGEDQVRKIVEDAAAEVDARHPDEDRVRELVAEAAPVASSEGAPAAGVDPSAVEAIIDQAVPAKVAEMTKQMMESDSFKEFLTDRIREQAPQAGDGEGTAPAGGDLEFTDEMITKLANSDTFYRMITSKFRQMQQYITDDILPQAVNDYLEKLYAEQGADAEQPEAAPEDEA